METARGVIVQINTTGTATPEMSIFLRDVQAADIDSGDFVL